MIDWAADFIDAIGLIGVAALVALENVFPPIPSELVLLLTGFNVSETRFGYVGAVVFATIGSVVGALLITAIWQWYANKKREATREAEKKAARSGRHH